MKKAITLTALATTLGLIACGGKKVKVYEGTPTKASTEDIIGISDIVVESDKWRIGSAVKTYSDYAKDTLQLIEKSPDYKPLIKRAIKEGYLAIQIESALKLGLTYRVAFWHNFAKESGAKNLQYRLTEAKKLETKYRTYLSILNNQGLSGLMRALPQY